VPTGNLGFCNGSFITALCTLKCMTDPLELQRTRLTVGSEGDDDDDYTTLERDAILTLRMLLLHPQELYAAAVSHHLPLFH